MRRLVIAGLLAMLLVFAGQVLAQDDVSLPPASWYAWIYGGDNEQLYLVNPDGLQATVLRPTLASEVAGGMRQMLVSRDGRYLVQAFSLEDDRYALLIYDFLTGTTTPILTNPGQEIRLGHLGAASFDADSQTVAITLVEMEPGFSEWSVALIDLETGSLAAQITRAEIIANLTGGSAMLVDALSNVMGTFFPVPTYIDDGGNVHFQVVLGFAGGAPTYPAFSWNPQTNAVTASPYVQSSGQIHLPSGDMIYAITDPALASIEPAGPYEPNNTIVRGTPLGAGIDSRLSAPPGLAARIGPDELTEALGALLENAMRHARGVVRISARRKDGRILIAIQDDGPGVPEAELERLTQRGLSLDPSGEGQGIGLAVVADIVDAAQGELRLRNAHPGFLAELHLEAAPPASQGAAPSPFPKSP